MRLLVTPASGMAGVRLVVMLALFKHVYLTDAPDECTVSTTHLEEGQKKTLVVSPPGKYITGQYFYLHYQQGLTSLGLKINGSSGELPMRFLIGKECFGHHTYWWNMHVTCSYSESYGQVQCVMVGGDCRWYCHREYISEDKITFSIEAEGPSAWRLEPSTNTRCWSRITWLWRNRYPSDERMCRNDNESEPFSTSRTPYTGYTTYTNNRSHCPTSIMSLPTIIAVVVAVVMVVVVIIIVIVVVKRKSRAANQTGVYINPPVFQRPSIAIPVTCDSKIGEKSSTTVAFPTPPGPKTEESEYSNIYEELPEVEHYLTPLSLPP